MPLAKLMTNILPRYYQFIEMWAKETKRSKRAIVEEALQVYMREIKREKILKQYQAMQNDEAYQKEMVEMANLGMDYYLKDIDGDQKV